MFGTFWTVSEIYLELILLDHLLKWQVAHQISSVPGTSELLGFRSVYSEHYPEIKSSPHQSYGHYWPVIYQ